MFLIVRPWEVNRQAPVFSPGGAAVNSQGCKPLGGGCQPLGRDRAPVGFSAPEGRQSIARGVNPWIKTGRRDVLSPGGAAVNSQGRKTLGRGRKTLGRGRKTLGDYNGGSTRKCCARRRGFNAQCERTNLHKPEAQAKAQPSPSLTLRGNPAPTYAEASGLSRTFDRVCRRGSNPLDNTTKPDSPRGCLAGRVGRLSPWPRATTRDRSRPWRAEPYLRVSRQRPRARPGTPFPAVPSRPTGSTTSAAAVAEALAALLRGCQPAAGSPAWQKPDSPPRVSRLRLLVAGLGVLLVGAVVSLPLLGRGDPHSVDDRSRQGERPAAEPPRAPAGVVTDFAEVHGADSTGYGA